MTVNYFLFTIPPVIKIFFTFLCLSLISSFSVFGNVQPVVMGWNINTDRRVDAAEINDPRYEHTIHAFGSISALKIV